MMNLKDLEDLEARLDKWEEDANDAIPSTGFKRTSDWDYAVKEKIKDKHSDEIEDMIQLLEEDQASVGSDHDELTPDNEKYEAEKKLDKIEVILDRLHDFLKA